MSLGEGEQSDEANELELRVPDVTRGGNRQWLQGTS